MPVERRNSDTKEPWHDEAAIFFDGFSMVFAFIGAVEFGFLYTTIFTMMLMMFAFNEMMGLSARLEKERMI